MGEKIRQLSWYRLTVNRSYILMFKVRYFKGWGQEHQYNLPPLSRQDSLLLRCCGFPGITIRHPGQHYPPMLPQDQIGQVQNISVSPDTQVTREEKAQKGRKGEDGNDGCDANRHSPLRGRQRKHQRCARRYDKRSEETGPEESGRERCTMVSSFRRRGSPLWLDAEACGQWQHFNLCLHLVRWLL